MKLQMGLDHIFKYREILAEKEKAASRAGTDRVLKHIQNSILAIDIMLHTALINTVQESAPQIKSIAFFDIDALQLVLPDQNLKALMPTQVEINFEEVPNNPVQITPGSPASGIGGELYEALKEMLSRNFVAKIPDAVKYYKEKTEQEETNVKVWEEIKKLLPENKHIPIWERHLLNSFRSQGPLFAYAQIKKNLPSWSDVDITTILNNLVHNEIATAPYSTARELDELLASLKTVNNHKIAQNPIIIEAIKLFDKNATEQEILKKVCIVNSFCNPSKREQILKRQAYIEKGY